MSRTTGLGPAALVAVALAAALAAPGATASTYDTPDASQSWTRGTVIAPGLQPPAAFAPIGIVDDPVDGAAVSDVAQAGILAGSPGRAPTGDPITAHGTEVASVAAARADNAGVIGIAPGAPLLSWGYDERSGEDPTCDEVTDGIVRLADAGAKVINLSVETPDDCTDLRLAIGAAYGEGALIVASAGNDGRLPDPPAATYPAQYPHVLTVGALSLGLTAADFSTPGSGVDLVAPGEAVPVALPPALDKDGTADGLTTETGTSFAAPIVSGLASWLIAARPRLEPGQVADLLRATARDEGDPGWDAKTGFGLPVLASALTARLPQADNYEPNDLITEVDGIGYNGADPYRSGTLKATIQPVEDPADVYRIRVKAHGRATARLTGGAGTKLYAYASKAKSFDARPLATGARSVTVRNATKKAATYYLAVREPATTTPVATSIPYTLKIKR
ncbi:S8 family peptidase [Conexibacter woesei]|uniref:S8 family peptidase n=1 Tax=Conexibacter woesei TaxID=191495 RepID=UPI00040FCA81|nr:S8 family serine peptidase [Conexibacter woesei]